MSALRAKSAYTCLVQEQPQGPIPRQNWPTEMTSGVGTNPVFRTGWETAVHFFRDEFLAGREIAKTFHIFSFC